MSLVYGPVLMEINITEVGIALESTNESGIITVPEPTQALKWNFTSGS